MNDVKEFIKILWGTDAGCFRAFHETDKSESAINYTGSFDDVVDELTTVNQFGFGVFFIPNRGGHKDNDINQFTSLYIDIDGDKGQTLPTQWHVQPSYILQRENNYHAYWLLDTPNVVTAEEFTAAQKTLINFYGTDKPIHNPSRVMRLPGFLHQKRPDNPTSYSILFDNSIARYSMADLTSSLPVVAIPAPIAPQALPVGDANVDEVRRMLGTLDPDMQYEEWLQVGMGLKHKFHESIELGFTLFNEWSSGATRTNVYNPAEVRRKWDFDIKSQARDGKASVTIATIADMAIKGGYRPANHVDPAEVFGRALLVPTLVVAHNPVLEFNQLPPFCLSDATSHTGNNAMTLLANYYGQRLYGRDKSAFWWSGEKHQRITDKQLLRSVSSTFIGTEQHKENVVNGTFKLAKLHAPEIAQLNPPNAKVYFNNGYIDFGEPVPITGRVVQPHAVDNYNTYTLPFDYDRNADTPVEFMKFFDQVFEGDPDIIDKIAAIQEVLAWAIIGDTLGIQKSVVLRGSTRAGKGTVLNVLSKLLGDQNYTAIGNLSALTEDKTKSAMRDTNVAIDFDAKSVDRRDIDSSISMINKITANEPTDIKLLYTQDVWNGPLNCKLYMACNALPSMIDDTGAIVGRLHQIMFNHSFLGREDTHLSKRLDAELSDIGNWVIKGLERLVINRKFTVPESSVEAQLEASETSQPLVSFVNECLILGGGETYKIHLDVIFTRWQQWCEENSIPHTGTRPNFSKRFNDTVRSKGVTKQNQVKIDGRNRAGFVGVSLAPVAPSLQIVQ